MKMATVVLGVAGLALGAGLVAATQVHGGSVGHGGHGPYGGDGALAVPHMVEWLVDNALDNIGASEAQRTRVLAVKDRVMTEARTLHAAHETTHEEFKRQWEMDKMDSARLHTLVDARLDDLRKVLHDAVDGVVEVHDTLTPEQRRMLIARLQAMHGGE